MGQETKSCSQKKKEVRGRASHSDSAGHPAKRERETHLNSGRARRAEHVGSRRKIFFFFGCSRESSRPEYQPFRYLYSSATCLSRFLWRRNGTPRVFLLKRRHHAIAFFCSLARSIRCSSLVVAKHAMVHAVRRRNALVLFLKAQAQAQAQAFFPARGGRYRPDLDGRCLLLHPVPPHSMPARVGGGTFVGSEGEPRVRCFPPHSRYQRAYSIQPCS